MGEKKPRAYYIANCIWRAIHAGVADKHLHAFTEDLAEAVVLAGNEGIEEAHEALIALCKKAESGGYGE